MKYINLFSLLLLFCCLTISTESVLAQDELNTARQITEPEEQPSVILPVEQRSEPVLEWQDDATLTAGPPLLEPLQPSSQEGSTTRSVIELPAAEAASQDPYDLDSLEPVSPALPEMDFPYRQPIGPIAPQNSLKPALPFSPSEPTEPVLPADPISPAAPVSRPTLGVVGRPIEGWGFEIQSVVPGSVAARMRLEPGDVILAVNGKRSCSAASITQQLLYSTGHRDGQGVVLIDNVRARQARTVKTCRGSYSAPSRLRFQKIGFQF